MAASYLPEGGQDLEADLSLEQFPGKNVWFFFQCIISKQCCTFIDLNWIWMQMFLILKEDIWETMCKSTWCGKQRILIQTIGNL